MIQRVRLQRKFALRTKFTPAQRIAEIFQMMVLFELTFIVVTALLSFSPHFHLHHLFTTEFWTAETIINSNLSLAVCMFLLLPYLICGLNLPGSSVKDFVATALSLHFILSFLINMRVTLPYAIFMVVMGVVCGVLGSYGAVLRQQKRLVDEIQRIEVADGQSQGLPVEECEKMQLCPSDN